MIVRVGIDAVDLARIEKHVADQAFLDRVLTPNERGRAVTPAYLAGRFAAKEAVKKCLPLISSWHDVEILTGDDGSPLPSLKPGILPQGAVLHVSISHEKSMAVAVAILESHAGQAGPGA